MTEILKKMGVCKASDTAEIVPFKNAEDGADYDVWKVTVGQDAYVLKKAKGHEMAVYSTFFAGEGVVVAPRRIAAVTVDGTDYFLMEYVNGTDLCRCDRASLTKTLDALISLQDRYWEADEPCHFGYSFAESLQRRESRGQYLGNADLERAYGEFLVLYQTLPRTLCHDDLLPFNVLVSDAGAKLIDWECAGILPYPVPLARLIAHGTEDENAFFYMKEEDKGFAIEYYYEHLVSRKGIVYAEYRKAMHAFLLYEYCEWIMLGNKYGNTDTARYQQYLRKALSHLQNR